MIGTERVAATRINLIASRRRLAQVARGAKLVRRKRDALVSELFRLAQPAAHVRAEIEAEFVLAYESLLVAFGRHGRAGLRSLSQRRTLEARIAPTQIWGIAVSDIVERASIRRMIDARGIAPATAGEATNDAANRFEKLADRLLEVAATENRLRRLSAAVAKESRHLRTLEDRLAPSLRAQIARLGRTLQEREREEYLRLKHLQRRTSGNT